MSEEFEVLAEWIVRKLRLPEAIPEEKREEYIKRWVMYSLGLEKTAQDIYLYIERKGSVTSTEIAKQFNISPNTARKYLDDLHTLGLVDYIGREYRLEFRSLSKAIEMALIPRIEDTLRTIAKTARLVEREITYTGVAEMIGEEGKVSKIVFMAPMEINNRLLESWFRAGRKVSIKCMGPLTLTMDIDPELADKVIERIVVMGPLTIPSQVYAILSDKVKAIGTIKII